MSIYSAPLQDYRFLLDELAEREGIAGLPGCEELDPETVDAILAEAGRFCAEVLAPLNTVGDREGAALENGVVRTATGFKEAYDAYRDGGWTGINGDPEWGGQALPWTLTTALNEFVSSANMAFGLCPILAQAGVELLQDHASAAQKERYLPRLISGEWTATMNLTEPQAGSDLGRIRTRAVADGDHYRLTGQKIFITYGEHDFTDNIIHLVLARTPDAPPGTAGISLFIVPKFLANDDGTLGPHNDLRCVSLEQKLGVHASPTAVMSYGDDGGAIGYLIGEENRGLQYMFTMMNSSRLAVGIQGVGIAEAATQIAQAYAAERVQGSAADRRDGEAVTIIHHPDVRRMLLTMRVRTEACRAVALYTAACQDVAQRAVDPALRERSQSRLDLLTPIVKAWSTDIGIEAANTAIQVHGGVGYIEETGIAQLLRDGRITAIYEGTNGIQAGDLVRRKILRDEGRAVAALLADIRADAGQLESAAHDEERALAAGLHAGCDAVANAVDWLTGTARDDPAAVAGGASYFLRVLGDLVGGWLMARGALAARRRLASNGDDDPAYLRRKIQAAHFYAETALAPLPAAAAMLTRAAPLIAAAGIEDI